LAGSDVTMTGAGLVTVRAAQTGDSTYAAATPVDRSFTVSKAAATVTLGSLSPTYDGTAKNATATTNPAGLGVSFTYDGSATAPTNAGSYAVVGTVSHAHYAGSASGTLVIVKADQTITFTGPAHQSYSTTPITLSASASSGLPVSFSVVSGPATLATATLTLTGAGVVTVKAAQSGDANRHAAPEVDRSFTVTGNYVSWLQAKFTADELLDPAISGADADPDHDGFVNLLEYALGFEPKAANTTGLPEAGTLGTDWTYTYTRPADRTDLAYEVESSTDLVNWTTAGVTHELVSAPGGNEIWRGRRPLAGAANCYFRLKITRP
ncbi:MAG: MBG domain-containing protein, partial [Lacunisphaera sp.]|nr:MBG domain-containing protein [Lacunisphaera sp.]